MTADAVIEANGLTKTYGSALAVDHISFGVGRGEIFGLLGPNGAGKTTTILMMLGLTEISEGGVHVLGFNPAREPLSVKRRVGYLPDTVGFYDNLTAADNLRYTARLIGFRSMEREKRIAAALDRVGLAGFRDAYPRELSGGMKMRVSIARALVTDPSLLLMDEPFAALDEITRFKLNDDLLQMWQALQTTVVFVTHSVFESVYLASRVVVMAARPGRVFSELAIDAPYPRDRNFRTSSEYAAFCREASAALAQAMAAGAEP